jgi:type VI protein secretion system component VasK
MKIRNEKMSAAKAAKWVPDLEEEDHDVNRTPPKKRKQTLQKYKDSYHNLWPCLTASKRGECMVHCTVCKSDFSTIT